jgi:nucleoside-diphosphate-sugar epimerase
MTRVLVTGASGFVGNILCPMLAQAGYHVRAAVRGGKAAPAAIDEQVTIGEIDGRTDWMEALRDIELVIHLAARAHVLDDPAEAAALYVETNANGTQRLAAEAARHGVRRFIFLSSVKVNGEESSGHPYRAGDSPDPRDAYARSKWQAEQHLWETVASAAMQAAVVRAPLVYGSGVRANFFRLLRWIDRERPLPLGAVRNRRSLVSAWTLSDLLIRLLDHPAAINHTWMVSDGEDISTPDLVRRIARLMGRRARLLQVPASLLRVAAEMLGKGPEVRRLCGSLTVDIEPTRERLGWSPPMSMDEALARTVSWYQCQRPA